MTGLVDRGKVPGAALRNVVNGFVVAVDWAELQPEPWGPITEDNPLDVAIAEVRRLHEVDPELDLAIKLRIFGGLGAPEQLKALSGEPILVTDPQDQVTGTIGRFWTDDYGSAYEDLHAKLADRYDDVPELRVVTISRCMTVYAEPFTRNTGDEASVASLLESDYDSELDRACMSEQIEAHQVWTSTRSGLALSPFQVINQDGSVDVDLDFTISMMEHCRDVLGERCVLENNNIRWPPFKGRQATMHEKISEFGWPISLQTAKPSLVGDLASTVEWAIGRGANAVELPHSYRILLSPEELQRLDAALEANPIG
jgi:hypothetical protein